MKILVTGSSGMVGRAISEIVSEYNNEWEWVFTTSKEVDLRDYNQTLTFLQKCRPTHVIHLAANVGGLYKNINCKIDMFNDNMLINMNVVKACNEVDIQRMICCLSTCIFPDKVDKYPIVEQMLHLGPPHYSNDAYAYSKRMLHILCNLYNKSYNREYICIIPCNIYGTHDNFNLEDAHVIPALVHKAYIAHRDNTDFIIKGSGKALRQFINSKDVAKLCIWLLLNYKETEPVILAPTQVYSIADVVDLIRKYTQLSYRQIVYDESYLDGQYIKRVSNHKFMELYRKIEKQDYKFIPFEEGLKSTIEWFKNEYDTVRT